MTGDPDFPMENLLECEKSVVNGVDFSQGKVFIADFWSIG